LLSDGSCGIIEGVREISFNSPQTTYNFEVADFHTYYVGEGVLVHNMNGQPCGGRSNAEMDKVADDLGYSKTKKLSHGQRVYYNSKVSRDMQYISPDFDSHVGGAWKVASSVKNLGSRATRTGTFDLYLRRKLGP